MANLFASAAKDYTPPEPRNDGTDGLQVIGAWAKNRTRRGKLLWRSTFTQDNGRIRGESYTKPKE